MKWQPSKSGPNFILFERQIILHSKEGIEPWTSPSRAKSDHHETTTMVHFNGDFQFKPMAAVKYLKVPPFPVVDEGGDRAEGGAALEAEEGPLARVNDLVDVELLDAREGLAAVLALVRTAAWKTTAGRVATH